MVRDLHPCDEYHQDTRDQVCHAEEEARWPCPDCGGTGCPECRYVGVLPRTIDWHNALVPMTWYDPDHPKHWRLGIPSQVSEDGRWRREVRPS